MKKMSHTISFGKASLLFWAVELRAIGFESFMAENLNIISMYLLECGYVSIRVRGGLVFYIN